MGMGVKTGSITTEFGTSDFLFSFFSTVSDRLEPDGWGTRYPRIMNDLYQGRLSAADVGAAIDELKDIRERLAAYSPDQVIWDIENLDAKPPWGDRIADTITDLSNYFWTSGGKDLFALLLEVLEYALKRGFPAEIVETPPFRGWHGEFYFNDVES